MNEDIKEILKQLEQAYTNSACLEPEKAKRYYDAISNLQHNWNELKKCIKDEIERTENLIKEDCDMLQINNIRKMLNEDRECWLYKMVELEEVSNE